MGQYIENRKIRLKTKNNLKTILLITLFLCFTLCIFAPLELYKTNFNEYSFSIYDIVPIMLKVFFALMAATLFFFFLLIFLPEKVENIIITFVFSAALSLYIQGNYIGGNYGVLDGRNIQWNSYIGYAIASVFVWGVCIIGFQFLLFKFKYSIQNKIINYISIFILLIEAVTLIILLIPNGFEKKENAYMTTESLFEMSSKENVIVLILDSFDSEVFSELLKKEEELNDTLKDFTYYPNTVGMYATTIASVPYILTGKKYLNNQEFNSYVNAAYEESSLYSYLNNNDFRIQIYGGYRLFPSEIDIGIDNVSFETEFSQKKLGKTLYKLCAFRYLPHQLKKYFWLDTSEFDNALPDNVYVTSDELKVWNELVNGGISLVDDKKYFKVYHLKGMHRPYKFNREMQPLAPGEEVSENDLALGNMKLVEEFLNQLKSQNIYDKSAILILADHGKRNMHAIPLLLSKNYEEEHEEMKLSNAPISYEDIYPTLEFLSGMEPENKTIFDIDENRTRERRYYWYDWGFDWAWEDYMPDIKEYATEGEANNLGDYIPTGTIYTKDGIFVREKYKIVNEDIIYFNGDDKCKSFMLTGFAPPVTVNKKEEGYAWSLGDKSRVEFECENISEDIKLTFTGAPINQEQEIICYLNDKDIGIIRNIAESFEIILPAEYLNKGLNRLTLTYPKAISPKAMGVSEDTNQYCFMYRSVKIEPTSSYLKISKDSKLMFNQTEEYASFVKAGFTEPFEVEKGTFGSWSKGNESIFALMIDSQEHSLDLKFALNVINDEQIVEVSINDNLLDSYEISGNELIVTIPKKYFNQPLKIEFKYPNAISPKEMGASEDTQKYSILVESVDFILQK